MKHKEIGSEPVELASLVNYQEGGIVSRTITDRPSGTVTLFAFAAGQALSEHTAPFDAILLGLDGQAEVTIAGNAHQVGPGEMILMPASRPHAVKATTAFKMLLIMIRS